ncbi:MAG: Asp-tRNA(Asn)/Glu-tRNA(Gln) amidotransferase subunit GatB [Candidatus Zixiibacteriota bacterium]
MLAGENEYIPVIGLEIHAQLQTESKIFCGCRNAFGEQPNSLTCPVCLGLPGVLPVLNKQAVEYAIRAILALGGTVRRRSVFARKNYFYPDLPKGYQISQYDRPLGERGDVRFTLADGQVKSCRIKRIHLEEDAGKSLHPEGDETATRLDFNRCGAPLIEIVTEPDIGSAEEAYACLVKLKQILQYLDICAGDMEKGHLRCDANISIRRPDSATAGTRTEVKNMNSFKAVEKALQFEFNRQTGLMSSGKPVEQATLLWNEKEQRCEIMRAKEESPDYRYFPDPDLVELTISDDWIERARLSLPEMPDARATRFATQYGLREYDATVLTDTGELADYFETVMQHYDNGRTAANWVQTELLGLLKDSGGSIASCNVRPDRLADLLRRVDTGEVSARSAKTVLHDMLSTGAEPRTIIEERKLAQVSDQAALESLIEQILRENPDNVAKYRSGKTTVLDFFAGQVMKLTRGRANPTVAVELLRKKLDEQ